MSEANAVGSGVVERYLTCLGANDWDGLADTIADEDLIREGPFCDVVDGKEPYIAFLRGVFSHLEGYELKVQRVSQMPGRVSYVELTETFAINGVPTEYPECIRFEQNDDGLISRVSVFIKRPEAEPAVEGGRAR